MTSDIIFGYIQQYGYLAVFLLVFIQEMGVPNPVPNELILLFSGYMAFLGKLSFSLVFLSAVLGDFLGTCLLYFIFHYFGKAILKNKPAWIPISKERVERISNFISKKGTLGIFIGRLIPYFRGYVSVVAGLIQIPPKVFLPTVLISACLWSGGYVILGRILGSQWKSLISYIGGAKNGVIFLMGVAVLVYAIVLIRKKSRK